jgi:carboxymethylenebutenolidase
LSSLSLRPRRLVAHEHIYWDQASLLVRIGLFDRADLPVTGAEQAENVLDPSARPMNEFIGERR